ncbi:MAG: glycosyltransferase family 2 protein [Chloroflexi bacterium]|nr:glycosyltransferase family 2 protein [Chloroflexota bacterium]
MPRVTVIVPTYNGAGLLPACLDALAAQAYADFTTLVVDDGSTDDTLRLLADRYSAVTVLALPHNIGLAAAVNRAIDVTDCELVALLNNDAEAQPGWLAALVATADRYPAAAAVASRLRLHDRPDHLHSAGDGYSWDGIPVNVGVWQPDGPVYDVEREVWAACAGAALYRRAALATVRIDGQVFDEALFMYCEDVDLGWRLRLAGYSCVYAPAAIVYHRLSATGGGILASYWCGRNFVRVALTNLPAATLRRAGPAIARAQVRLAGEALRHGREPAARARLRGQLRALADLPAMLRRRRQVQRLLAVEPAVLERLLAPSSP